MIHPRQLRAVHRTLAPIVVAPLLLTVITGMLFQGTLAAGTASDYLWLLELHRGHFGPVNLDRIYPFLNGLGVVVLAVSGIVLWFQGRRRGRR